MKVARGNAPSEYPPSDSESRSDALAGVRFFGKLGLVGKLPRSVLGICTARRAPPKAAARVLRKPTASRPSRWIVRKICEARKADESAPRARANDRFLPSLGRVSHDGPRARGGRSQPFVGSGEAKPNAPAPRGLTTIQPKFGRVSQTAARGGGSGGLALEKAKRSPKRRAARDGGND